MIFSSNMAFKPRAWMMIRFALFAFALLFAAPSYAAADRAQAREELRQGLMKFQAGDLRAANVFALNAVKADPGFAMAQAIYGRILLEFGNGEFAQKALNRAVKLGMNPKRVNHLLGHAAFLLGDFGEAAKRLAPDAVLLRYHPYAARIMGDVLSSQGNFAAADRAFEDAVRLDPKNARVWVDLGRHRLATGNIAGGIEAATRAVKLNTKDVEAMILMGEMMRAQYGLVAAIPWFERALVIDNQHLGAMSQLAATYGDVGRNRAMLAITRRMLIVDEGNAMAYYYQATLAARANRPDIARGLLYRIGDRLETMPGFMFLSGALEIQSGANEQAVRKLKPLLDLQPGNDKIRRLVGAALFRSGDNDGAINILMPLVRRPDADSYALTIVGRALEEKGFRGDAAQYLDKAAVPMRGEPSPFDLPVPEGVADPNNAARAIPEIARLIGNGRATDALARARYVQSRNPGVPAAHILIGDSLVAIGRYREAADAYRVAANLNFNEGTALRLVKTLVKAGLNGDALRVLDLFISQNPRNIAARVLAADVFLDSKAWPRAIAVMEGLRTQVGDRDAMLLNDLAWAYLETGEEQKAVNYASAAYEIAQTNPIITDRWGWTLFKTGRNKEKGLALLEKASAMDAANPDFRFHLAQALAGLGRKDEARRALQSAIAAPMFSNRDAAQAFLKRL
jgi:cellulose synthase operon protein C